MNTINKHEDGTIELKITIPSEDVKKAWDAQVELMVKNATVEGFRKGKAPRKLVEDRLDKEKIREEVLKKLLPSAYVAAIQKHTIKPIVNPKIHVERLEDPSAHSAGSGQASSGQVAWAITATTCELPKIDLGKYKDAIQKMTTKSKIIIPGKEPFGNAQDKAEKPKFDDIVKTLLQNVVMTIPSILVEQEVERLLAQTFDEIKRLGLSLDQYLSTTGRTPQALRAEYEEKAKTDMRLEFALQKIAEEEKITVEEKEITEALQKAKDEKERANLESNRYLLASILRQQKTLDFLRNL